MDLTGFVRAGYYKVLVYEYKSYDDSTDPAEVAASYSERFADARGCGFVVYACAPTQNELAKRDTVFVSKCASMLDWLFKERTHGGIPDVFSSVGARASHCSPIFQELSPVSEWMKPRTRNAGCERGTLCFLKPPPVNFVTVSYGIAGHTSVSGDSCYGVIRGTGFDFWIVRRGLRFVILNAGVFATRLEEMADAVTVLGHPPSWCDFVWVKGVTDTYLTERLYFNTDTRRRSEELIQRLEMRHLLWNMSTVAIDGCK